MLFWEKLMSKKILLLSLCLIFCFVCGCSKTEQVENVEQTKTEEKLKTSEEELKKLPDNQRFKREYEEYNYDIPLEIVEDNTVSYIDKENILSVIENKTGIVYFGYPSCPWCRNAVPILVETAVANQLPIYYFDLTQFTEVDDTYNSLLEIINKHLGTENQDYIDVPLVLTIQNGTILASRIGTVGSHTDPYVVMTQDEMLELSQRYQEIIDFIKLEN